jgi:hypothetical protein
MYATTGGTGTNNAGMWIRYDTDLSDTTYIFQMCNTSGGCTTAGDSANSRVVASTEAPVSGTWNRFRIRYAAVGVGGNPTYYFSVGSAGAMETEKTFCSTGCDDNLTAASTAFQGIGISYVTRTTTGVLSADVDLVGFSMTGLSRY